MRLTDVFDFLEELSSIHANSIYWGRQIHSCIDAF